MQEGRGPAGPAGRERQGSEGPGLDKLVEVAADKADCTSAGRDLGVVGNNSYTCWVVVAGSGPRASWPDPLDALASHKPEEGMGYPFVLPAA